MEAVIWGHVLIGCRYSTNQDISRARQAFFSGKSAFLLISERFHFYRRYVTRDLQNIEIFHSLGIAGTRSEAFVILFSTALQNTLNFYLSCFLFHSLMTGWMLLM